MSERFEVVISGISGRFPECDDVDTFKEKLYDKENTITYDNRKWPTGYRYKFGKESIPCGTGKFSNIQKYDTSVFAVSATLANQMDVLNRMVLEPCFEAVLDAGINPTTLMGANVACYLSAGIGEIESIKVFSSLIERMGLIGCSKAMLSNRVSFALNLTGPSHTFYHGALGGLDAMTIAYDQISSGQIDAALVGAPNSIIDPKLSLQYVGLGYLSPDALCRAFDESANGYGRSEGVVIFYLQKKEEAKRNYGTVVFCESIFCGINPNTFLGFDEEIIEKTFHEIYSKNKHVNPANISFVEMDAMGVKRLDILESNVVANIFCKGRKEPLLVGSVKSNTGHTEAAAGYLSILKAIYALDSDTIPPNMHFSKPNPDIKPLIDGTLKVVDEACPLPGSMVAVNSFSVCGEVNHVVLKQNLKKKNLDDENDKLPRLLVVCGRTKEGLEEIIKKIEQKPLNKEMVWMTNDIFKTPLLSHIFRGYTILPISENATNSAVDIIGGEKRPIWFIFSGMGSQWNGMGKGLLEIPIFAEAVDRCDKVLRPHGIDIRHILTSDDHILFENIVHAFVGIITIQVGLVNILKTIGIEPDGIVGHSVGENACAYADGCLTLEQAVLASYARGVASIEVETIKGMMAAIGKGYNQIKDTLPEEIEVACHNSADNCTLTGPVQIVNEFVEKLQNENIFARAVNVSNIAYHSKHIAPAAPMLLKRLKEIIVQPKERSSKWISSSIPEAEWESALAKTCSAEYLTNNLLSPVLFEEACKHIPENAIVIEIAPHGLLQAILKRSLRPTSTNVSLTLRSQDSNNAVNCLLTSIGKLFIAGCLPDVNALYPKIQYPVPRGTPSISPLATWDHSNTWGSIEPMRDKPLSGELISIKLNKGNEYSFIKAHQIKGHKVIPPSLYMYLTWQIFSLLRNEKLGNSNIVFEDVRVLKHVNITMEKYRNFTIMIHHGSGNFEVLLENKKDSDNPKVLMTGIIQVPYDHLKVKEDEEKEQKTNIRISGQEFYEQLKNVGYELEDNFCNVQEISLKSEGSSGKIKWNENWVCFLDGIMKVCMHSHNRNRELLFPFYIRELAICTSVFENLRSGDEIKFYENLITKQFWCKGIDLRDFRCKPVNLKFLRLENTLVELQAMKFVPHSYPNLKNTFKFLNLCLQLAVESTVLKNREVKLNIVDSGKNFLGILKKILSQYFWMKSNVTFSDIKDFTAGKFKHGNAYLLIVDSFYSLEKLKKQVKNKLDNLYVLVVASPSEADFSKVDKSFIEMANEISNDNSLHFFKKLPDTNGHIPQVLLADDCWSSKFDTILKSKRSEPVFLLRHSIELADLNEILTKQKKYPNIRCLYIMDEQAPQFSIDNSYYKKQISQDLPVSILKNGQWGSYRNLDCDSNIPTNKYDTTNTTVSEYKLQSIDLRFLCTDLKNSLICSKSDIKGCGFEFSGISESGQRKMGLGFYNPLESLREADEAFMWQIPKHWSLEDAATIPLFYIQAYNLVFLTPLRDSKHTFFVNSDNLSFTEALIAVALHYDHEIYATVANDIEANSLVSKFPHLQRRNLLDREDCKYEIQLKLLTQGKGAEICINRIRGMNHVTAMLNCTRMFGEYIDMTDRKYETGEWKIGMNAFLKSILFSVAPNDVESLLQLPEEKKRKLHDLMENGFKDGAVRPLPRIVTVDENRIQCRNEADSNVKVMFKCYQEEKFQNNKISRKIKYDENHSVIIVSGGKKTKLWFELLEWLINRGARKFVVALDNFSVDPKISHQINRLLIQKKATIILTTLKKADTAEDAANLIAEANNVAPLEAVFFVSLDPAGSIIRNLDMASRSCKPFHFVCLFSGGLKECENRRKDGLPALLIHSEGISFKLTRVLQQMEKIMDSQDIRSSTLYQLVDKAKTKERSSSSLSISNFVSLNLEKLENIGYDASDTLEFKEISSLSQHYHEIKGVFPVFLLPSINADFIFPIASNILYPTFCATFTDYYSPAEKIAAELMKSLEKIQPKGPVTIVAETWSGCVGIELATIVKEKGRLVELFLIEGHPTTWQNYIQYLGNVNTSRFNNNLLKELISFTSKGKEEIENQNNEISWDECRENFLKTLKCSANCKVNITKAINGIRNRLITAAQYNRRGEFLNHVTLLKQRPSESSLDQFASSDDVFLFPAEKYQDFIKMRELTSVINDYALFKWWP